MSLARGKFSTQVAQKTLASIRELAKQEGRQFQAIVEEAFLDVIEKHSKSKPRTHVLAAHRASLGRYAAVYRKLAE